MFKVNVPVRRELGGHVEHFLLRHVSAWHTSVHVTLMREDIMNNTYFHFPPLLFSLFTSRPAYTAIPRLQTRQSHHPSKNHTLVSRAIKINSLYTQISSRENIHPLQPKASKHLHAPSPQAPHGDELLDELFVTGTNQHLS